MKSNRVTITLSSGAEARLRVFGKSLSEVIDMLSYTTARDYGRLFEAKQLQANMVRHHIAAPKPSAEGVDDLDALVDNVYTAKPEPVYRGHTYTGWLELIAKSEAEALEMEGDELKDRNYALSVAREHAEEARRLRDEQAAE